MSDDDILGRIEQLVQEEQRLRLAHDGRTLSAAERAQLQALEVRLDQCWDLLRQRRGREEFGQNPDEAQTRPPEVVERYLQ